MPQLRALFPNFPGMAGENQRLRDDRPVDILTHPLQRINGSVNH